MIPERVFCFGMPKCGTTTLANLLGAHPAICLHSQKEPRDFLPGGRGNELSGYAITSATRYLLDFTTTYGMAGNRDSFFAQLRGASLRPEQMRYILCIREPSDLARSYLLHIARRRGVDVHREIEQVRAEILDACDMTGAVTYLANVAGLQSGFLVHFSDLVTSEGQQRLAGNIFRWLGLPPADIGRPVWSNAAASATRYPSYFAAFAALLRRTNMVRNLPPGFRATLRILVSSPVQETLIDPPLIEEVLSWLQAQDAVIASNFLLHTTTSGPLEEVISENDVRV
ncbi:hypothetical protein [Mesorhizobium sp. 10J20-29]